MLKPSIIKRTKGKGELKMEMLKSCHDCAAAPGEIHSENCDVERCSVCGDKRLQCDVNDCKDHDKKFAKWTGIWPGKAEADYLGVDLNEFQKFTSIFFIK